METALRIRNILFKAFVINYAVIFIVWLIMLTGLYNVLMDFFFGFDPQRTTIFMVHLLGAWKIAGATLFLIPAAAIHWEYKINGKVKSEK